MHSINYSLLYVLVLVLTRNGQLNIQSSGGSDILAEPEIRNSMQLYEKPSSCVTNHYGQF